MMRSLYSGISGLRNHQTRMDVIGNNIANVNTAGYKTSRVIFQDIFSQNVAAGMANQGDIGGTNPTQIGLGIRLSTVDVIHSRAAFQRTDRETDMMINGDGFFIVASIDPVTGQQEPFYTRAGNFDIDNDGFLVNSQGLFVLGTSFELEMGVIDVGSPPIAGRPALTIGRFFPEIPGTGSLAPAGTPQTIGEWIAANAPADYAATAAWWDDDDNSMTIPRGAIVAGTHGREAFPPAPIVITDFDEFTAVADDDIPDNAAITAVGIPPNYFRPGDIIPANTFADQTAPITVTAENMNQLNNQYLPGPGNTVPLLPWPVTNRPPFNAMAARDPIFGLVQAAELPGLERIRLTAERMILPDINPATGLPLGAPPRDPLWTDEFYREQLEGWLADIAATAPTEEVGLPGFAVADNGDISVIIANRKVVVGKLAIAMFSNPPGLEKAGNSLYRESASSGPVVVTEAYLDGAGKVDGGGLEMSNVDLANEFTDMIVTQRGFQANSRIITVSDSMLEELVNLKR